MFLSLITLAFGQGLSYSSPEEFYTHMPPCTLVQVEQSTLASLGSLNYQFEWPYDDGAFVPMNCGFGQTNIVRLEYRGPGTYVPVPTDINTGRERARAIIGEEGVRRKYYLGRWNGEASITLKGLWYASNGDPIRPSGLQTATGHIIATATQLNAQYAATSTCTSTPVYPRKDLAERKGTITCE